MGNFEHVTLVDEEDNVIGSMEKSQAHDISEHLHRGFSVFLFDSNNRLLLQKRQKTKKTWPGFWSNSFCGHPKPDESYKDGAVRRGHFELGINVNNVIFVDTYRYKVTLNNTMENEICKIYLCRSVDQVIFPNFNEISEYRWINWEEFLLEIEAEKEKFTPWSIEEALIIKNSQAYSQMIQKIV